MFKAMLYATLFCSVVSMNSFAKETMNLNKVKDRMIAESIQSYSGNCPCPESRARNGSRCGKRSAYSRPNGASPLCYREDISDKEAEQYLKSH